ncbi:MAG TPA: hypothetical protein VFW48_02770 [Solirubrobacterales bacterium]|nr:hypothetical protein [Solirubrobacterales bacterium]
MRSDQVRFLCSDPSTDLTVEMGDGPATPTAGASNWEIIERVEDKGVTDRGSIPPFQQDVPLIFDGFSPPPSGIYTEGTPIQRDLDALIGLRGAVFRVEGPVYKTHLRYVFGGEPDYGEVIRDDDGTLLRQRLTLRLMEYVRPDTLGQRRKKRRGKRGVATYATGGSTYVTKGGENLSAIAHKLFGDWKKWKAIGDLNGIRDPLVKLKPGRVLKLPGRVL